MDYSYESLSFEIDVDGVFKYNDIKAEIWINNLQDFVSEIHINNLQDFRNEININNLQDFTLGVDVIDGSQFFLGVNVARSLYHTFPDFPGIKTYQAFTGAVDVINSAFTNEIDVINGCFKSTVTVINQQNINIYEYGTPLDFTNEITIEPKQDFKNEVDVVKVKEDFTLGISVIQQSQNDFRSSVIVDASDLIFTLAIQVINDQFSYRSFKSEIWINNFQGYASEITVKSNLIHIDAIKEYFTGHYPNTCSITRFAKLSFSLLQSYWQDYSFDKTNYVNYTEDFIDYLFSNNLYINWNNVDPQVLSDENIVKYQNHVNWTKASKRVFPESIYLQIKQHLIDYEDNDLSEDFMWKYHHELDVNKISLKTNLSKGFRNFPFLNKNLLAVNYKVSMITNAQELTKAIILKYRNTDPVIINPDLVDWDLIAQELPLSGNFIRKYNSYLNKDILAQTQYLPPELIQILQPNPAISGSYQKVENCNSPWHFSKFQPLSKDLIDTYTPLANANILKYQIPKTSFTYDDFDTWQRFPRYLICYKTHYNFYPITNFYYHYLPLNYQVCTHDYHFCTYLNDTCIYCENCELRTNCIKTGYTCDTICPLNEHDCRYCNQCNTYLDYTTQTFVAHADQTEDRYTFGLHCTKTGTLKCKVYYDDIVYRSGDTIRAKIVYI